MTELKLLIAVLFVFLPQIYCQRSIPPELEQKINDYVQNVYLPLAGIDGLGLTIVQNWGEENSILFTTGYGMANREKSIPITNKTQLLIGSNTKSIVGLLISKLLNEAHPELGDAVLDTPIKKLLPQAQLILNDRFRSEQVTFRDLLSHRVCLFNENLQMLADPYNSTDEIVFGQRYNQEVCAFRSQREYNNQMYVVAGELAGLIAGKPFEEAFQDLLNELGMNNSALVQKTDDFQHIPNRALPYYFKDGEWNLMNEDLVKRLQNSNAAGGLFVPQDDIARYIQLHLTLGKIDGIQVIPEHVMKWITKPVAASESQYSFKRNEFDKVFSIFSYGLGLNLGSYNGWQLYVHNGGWPGYESRISLFPGKKLGISSSVNNGPVRPSAPQEMLHFCIFEMLNGNECEDAEKVRVKARKSLKRVEEEMESQNQAKNNLCNEVMEKATKSIEKLQDNSILGHYGSGSLGELEIYEMFNDYTNETGIYLEYGRWYKGWLVEEESEIRFRLELEGDIVQDDYALIGEEINKTMIYDAEQGDLYWCMRIGGENQLFGQFKKGLRSGDLPLVPWEPDSCGPDLQ